jgi:hypothetical protein
MPPAPYLLPPLAPAQRRSPTDWSSEIVNTHTYHAARSPPPFNQPRDTITDSYYYTNAPQSNLPSGAELAGIVTGCVVGATILCGLLYYCWKLGQPRPTYYETAVEINEKRDACRCNRERSCSWHSYRETASMAWPYHTAIIDKVTRPKAARIDWSRKGSSVDNLMEVIWKERR